MFKSGDVLAHPDGRSYIVIDSDDAMQSYTLVPLNESTFSLSHGFCARAGMFKVPLESAVNVARIRRVAAIARIDEMAPAPVKREVTPELVSAVYMIFTCRSDMQEFASATVGEVLINDMDIHFAKLVELWLNQLHGNGKLDAFVDRVKIDRASNEFVRYLK